MDVCVFLRNSGLLSQTFSHEYRHLNAKNTNLLKAKHLVQITCYTVHLQRCTAKLTD